LLQFKTFVIVKPGWLLDRKGSQRARWRARPRDLSSLAGKQNKTRG